jgi:predicted dehydrogenase
MAKEYARVLSALDVDFDVIGRGEENCQSLNVLFPSVKVTSGGLENIRIRENYTHAIVATSVDSLFGNSKNLLKNGIKKILLEKPGGTSRDEISKLAKIAKEKKATVLLAYNRRFYSSVRKAKECIEEDGGVLSYAFEFTEWPHTIEALDLPSKVKQHWFLANSTHVVDTAFYLAGKPRKMKANTSGSLDWHSSAAIFAGTGVTEKGALFTYQANWKSPGRWGIEILTTERRLILRPMETLQVQHHKSVLISTIEIDDKIDKDFKPGLFLQTKSFLTDDWEMFCTIADQITMVEDYYNEMAGY